jgi:methionyl-tRNA formyltransferase
MNLRIVFMGSPDFAVPILRELSSAYSVVGVITQPDRPSGRGRILIPPPVKSLAQELGLPWIQPEKLRSPDAMSRLQDWKPDLIVVAAYGQILRPEVLDLPPYGCLNVHASLLPRWRGAAPIQAAILSGDEQTGVTIIRMDTGIDTGPLLSQRAAPIHMEDTAATLSGRLAALGAPLLKDTIPGYLSGAIIPQPQDDSQASYAPMLKKSDGGLDFSLSATYLERKVRAYHPWPGAFFEWQGQPLKIHRASAISTADQDHSPLPGQRLVIAGKPAVAASPGALVLDEVQPPGKKPMSGKAFLLGARNWV